VRKQEGQDKMENENQETTR